MLGIRPAPWTHDVVISRHNGLLANIGQELNMAQAVGVLGAEKVKDLQYFQGGDPNLTPDPAIDLSLINNSILDLYNAFRRPLQFGNGPAEEPTALEVSQADRAGHIAYQAVAITPLRPNWSGPLPVPGDGRYEWNGNPGQSGDPDSPHYRDLFELWSRGRYFPVFYRRSRVESVTEDRLTLTPAATTSTAVK